MTTTGGRLALVTGGTGFVGSHLVQGLLQDGWRVRCLVRPRSDRRWLPQVEIAFALGSVDDAESLGLAMDEVDVVFHLAAVTSASREADYDRVNHGGVVRVVDALSSTAPRAQLVFCSTLAVGGPAREGRPITEQQPRAPIGPYGVSKARAEEVVEAWAARGGRAVCIRPPAVYGPRDRDVLAAFRLARHGLAFRTGPKGQQLALIHVSDLVRGFLAAASVPGAQGTYYINGENLAWETIVQAMGAAMGRNIRVLPLPGAAVAAAGWGSRLWSRAVGTKPLLTPERARDLAEPAWICDDSRARRELGYQPRVSLDDGMRATAQWYRAAGWL